jgi:hypothetical protein
MALAAYRERAAAGCTGCSHRRGRRVVALVLCESVLVSGGRRHGLRAWITGVAWRLRVCVHIARGRAERCAGSTCLCLHCTAAFALRGDSAFLFALGLCGCIAQGLRSCIHIAWGAKAPGASVFPFGSFEGVARRLRVCIGSAGMLTSGRCEASGGRRVHVHIVRAFALGGAKAAWAVRLRFYCKGDCMCAIQRGRLRGCRAARQGGREV